MTTYFYNVAVKDDTGNIAVYNPVSYSISYPSYLWISNSEINNIQQELTPDASSVRGDIVIPDLGNTDDFDYALDATESKIAFVYKDLNNSNCLSFILYDTETNAIIHERRSIPITFTPQISYNDINDSWSIVAQTDTDQLLFSKRLASSSTWVEETVLSSGDGMLPSKPIHHTDGSVIVVTESGINSDVLISKRDTLGAWSTIYTSSGGGFKNPKFIKTLDNSGYWIFGSIDSSARIAWSSNLISGWGIWSGNPSLSSLGYSRVSIPVPLALDSAIVVATSATEDGTIPTGQEILIWRFENFGTAKVVGAFTAKGRIQSGIYSGEEEESIVDLSWTPEGKLLYGAYRPTRSELHWSLRGSTKSWNIPHGDSLLGSGRYITLGDKHFREQWGAAPSSGSGINGQDLIIEYPSLIPWSSLPLAQRENENDFTALKWPYSMSSGYLFTKGYGFNIEDDTDLSSGTLITSSLRNWPIILGSTRWSGIHHVGASVFSQGGMLGLYCPSDTTNLDYFGISSIGSDGLFKIDALNVLTFKGTRKWTDLATGNAFVLTGTISYEIDTSAIGSHLVFKFNTMPLILDSTETPLSYWETLNHDLSTYVVVIGEVRDEAMLLYPFIGARQTSELLTFGNREIRELSSLITEWKYSLPEIQGQSIIYELV